MPARNETSGQYTETYPTDVFVRALSHLDGEVGTKAVKEMVGCEYRTAIAKLHELEERGEITSRRVGNAYLWSVEEGRETNEAPTGDQSPQGREDSSGETDGEPLSGDGLYDPTSEWE